MKDTIQLKKNNKLQLLLELCAYFVSFFFLALIKTCDGIYDGWPAPVPTL